MTTPWVLAISTDVYIAIGAICTGIGGIVTAYAAVVKAKKESSDEAEKEMRVLSSKLHYWHMKHPDEISEEPQ